MIVLIVLITNDLLQQTPSQVMEQLVVVTKCISSILKGDRKSKVWLFMLIALYRLISPNSSAKYTLLINLIYSQQSFLQMKGYEILLTYFRETEASRELVDEVLYMV